MLKDDLFCSNYDTKQIGASEIVDYGRPQGKDWFAIAFTAIRLLSLFTGVFGMPSYDSVKFFL